MDTPNSYDIISAIGRLEGKVDSALVNLSTLHSELAALRDDVGRLKESQAETRARVDAIESDRPEPTSTWTIVALIVTTLIGIAAVAVSALHYTKGVCDECCVSNLSNTVRSGCRVAF